MPFEKFDETGSGRGRGQGTELMISIRKSESIGVNRAALDEFFQNEDGAVMYYDEDAAEIGSNQLLILKPTRPLIQSQKVIQAALSRHRRSSRSMISSRR